MRVVHVCVEVCVRVCAFVGVRLCATDCCDLVILSRSFTLKQAPNNPGIPIIAAKNEKIDDSIGGGPGIVIYEIQAQ